MKRLAGLKIRFCELSAYFFRLKQAFEVWLLLRLLLKTAPASWQVVGVPLSTDLPFGRSLVGCRWRICPLAEGIFFVRRVLAFWQDVVLFLKTDLPFGRMLFFACQPICPLAACCFAITRAPAIWQVGELNQ